ncbi:MAG: TIGR00730 family Rossman fold protein [Candidatus Zambryskibacteria bacterium]|nr:TIGR00730 family Rossman fold protein [Candidatus Zambryskibacteria bacterium]
MEELIKAVTLSKKEMHKIAAERVAEIAREFTAGFEFLEDYPKSVTFFGSTKSSENDSYYQSARALSARLVKELGYSIVSGGGPGIMEAADRGAYEAGGNSLGLLIKLPNGQPTNPYIKKSISFYYFFARKVCLAFGAEVFIFYPGGFGTLDEFFEIITLIQTQKMDSVPIICVGSEYWNKLKSFMQDELLKRGYIELSDIGLFTITDSHDEIIDIIKKAPVRMDVSLTGLGERVRREDQKLKPEVSPL